MGLEQQTEVQQKPESIALCTDDGLKHRQNAHVYEPEAAVAAAVNTESQTIAASFAMSGSSLLRQTTASHPADWERQQKQNDAKQPAAGVVVKQS